MDSAIVAQTTIRVSHDTWRRLQAVKDAPGATMDDVIASLLDRNDVRSGAELPPK